MFGVILTTLPPPAEAEETSLGQSFADRLLMAKQRHTSWHEVAQPEASTGKDSSFGFNCYGHRNE